MMALLLWPLPYFLHVRGASCAVRGTPTQLCCFYFVQGKGILTADSKARGTVNRADVADLCIQAL